MGGRGRWRSALCLAILAVLPFALFWRIAALLDVFAEGDLHAYNYPLLHAIAEQWRAGELPLWNPYLFGGTPLHGSMQGGAFYLPNVLIFFMPTWAALQYSILLHYALAGVFMFLFLRALTLDRISAMFGSVTFMLSGFAIGHLGHVDLLRTVPWLPLILYAFERWRRDLRRGYPALAAAAMGLMLVAGHPQVPLYSLLVAGAYALFAVRAAPPHERRPVVVGLAVAFAGGAALSAIQVLPTLQLAAQEFLRPTDHSYGYFVNYSLFPPLLVNLVFPRLVPVDEAELAVYVGILTLLLAAVGAGRPPERLRQHRRLFAAVTAAALVLAFGEWTPLSRLLFHVPLYNLFSCPARNLFEFAFAMSVLASLGLQSLRSAAAPLGLARRVAAGFVLVVALGAAVLAVARAAEVPFAPALARLSEVSWADPTVAGRLPVLAASLALLCAWPAARAWRAAASVAVLALAVYDLFSYGRLIYGPRPASVYAHAPRILAVVKAGAEGEPARTAMIGAVEATADEHDELMGPNLNTVHGVESINGFDSAILRQVDVVSGGAMPTYGLVSGTPNYDGPLFRRFMDLLGARYVLTLAREPLELAPPRYRPLYEDADLRVFENTEALPRTFLVAAARAQTLDQVVETLRSGQLEGAPFDPRRIALVEGVPPAALAASGLGGAGQDPSGRVRVLERRPGRVRFLVETDRPAVFVHSAAYSRGWKAALDAASTPVVRVYGLLQGVLVPAGRHEIALRYSPGSFWLGALVTLLAAGALGAFALSGRRRRAPAQAGLRTHVA
jgi:hypothetical protein